ncbi:hypothetical protein GCM10009664_73900 [Kitasatospora gansuensis]
MKSSLLPVNPGTNNAVPRTGPAGSATNDAKLPREVASRTALAQTGSFRNGGVLTPRA